MRLFSNISDGIRLILGRHWRREDSSHDLVPVVTPSLHDFPEGLINEVHAPHDVIEQNARTGK